MGLDDEEYAREDAARAEVEWGSEAEREAEREAEDRAQATAREELDKAREQVADLTRRLARSYRELQRADDDLEQAQKVLDGRLTAWGAWRDGQQLPDDVGLSDPDGDPIDVELDASGLLDEALRRQAAAVCRRIELSDPAGPELGAVLALVPAGYRLSVSNDWPRPYEAVWDDDEGHEVAVSEGLTREAAILAATAELLGLDESALRRRCSGSPADVVRAAINLADDLMVGAGHGERLVRNEQALIEAVEQLRAATVPAPDEPAKETCGTCANWLRDAEPESSAGARPCGLDTEPNPCPRHPASACGLPGSYVALAESDTDPVPSSDEQLPGVTLTDNLIRSEGDSDV